MKRVTVTEAPVATINIIPVIDVTMVLLVILLVMSPIINIPNLPVDLPEARTKETKEQNLTVSLGADGQMSVDMTLVSNDELIPTLKEALKSRSEDSVVIIRADKDLPYGKVEDLMRLVNRHVGRRAIAVATKQRSVPLQGQEADQP